MLMLGETPFVGLRRKAMKYSLGAAWLALLSSVAPPAAGTRAGSSLTLYPGGVMLQPSAAPPSTLASLAGSAAVRAGAKRAVNDPPARRTATKMPRYVVQ